MSDQLGAEVLNKAEELEDDPLAELARIVAGEPEPEEQAAGSPGSEPGTSRADKHNDADAPQSSAEEREASDSSESAFNDIDAELEQALAGELGNGASATQDAVDPEKVEAATSETDLENAIAEASLAIENELQEEQTTSENTFQDDLISALEQEITGPVERTDPEPGADVEQSAEETGSTEEEPTLTAEESTAAVLNEVLNTETVSPEIPVAETQPEEPDVVEETVEDDASDFEEPEQADEAAEEQDSNTVDLDEDLGAAFASEFEQMVADNPQPVEDVFADLEIEEPVSQNEPLVTEDLETEDSATEQAGEDTSPEELDFGAAFAEELGVEKITAVEGWSEQDTRTANAAFAEAAQPQAGGVSNIEASELQMDPGHAGALPADNIEEPSPAIRPDENGGSRKYAIVALVIALFAGSIAAGYGFLGGKTTTDGGEEPKLIAASTEPFKIKPEDPGGRVPANQDNASYEGVEGIESNETGQETLISETEEPADLGNEQLEVVETPETNLTEKSDERLSASESTSVPETNASSNVTPRVVQTVTVKPDGTIVTGTQSPQVDETSLASESEPSEEVQVASNTLSEATNTTQNAIDNVVAPAKPVETVTITKPESIDGAASSGEIAVPEASPLPKPEPVAEPEPQPEPVQVAAATPEPAPEAEAASTLKSEWVVQVSSQRSPEAAQASFQNLRNRFSALQGRPMSIQRALVNGSTFYRVRVQTASKNDAFNLCSSLKASGGSCFVTR